MYILGVRSGLEDLLQDLEALSVACVSARDGMGAYLLDLALEECREAIWLTERYYSCHLQ